ncbi:hypothetical protein CSW98_06675 [Vibrio sp. HA2012]|uniref:ABC transporter substrate-binding protein n=1 Tax=Vibrio sp. HA2012 TaxID=1971595 RepID=UPI000C2BF7F2|nr:ABC transporter substrate-binding protein [Vibrio sp. HA2012]PJC86672.1 hypothetical protein CSW98_06675 [Vibrio sp. HA2012]
MKNNQIYISMPVNISRSIMTKAKEICPDSEVFNSTKKCSMDDLDYLDKIKNQEYEELPDVLITLRPEYHWNKDVIVNSSAFEHDYQYEISRELQGKKVLDKSWVLKPLFIMPLVILYHQDLESPPCSWNDLLDERFKGKIVTTDDSTSPAVLLKHFFMQTKGERGKEFVESIDFSGVPIDVNRAVSDKIYDIGILPLSFAMFSKNNEARVCWPEEGALYLTQVMLLKNGFSEDARKIAHYLTSDEAQKLFSTSAGFVPVRPDIEIPKVCMENQMSLLTYTKEPID